MIEQPSPAARRLMPSRNRCSSNPGSIEPGPRVPIIKPVQGGEAHGRRHAFGRRGSPPCWQPLPRWATTRRGWNAAGDLRQSMQDRLIGEAVETIAPQAFPPICVGQRKAHGDVRLRHVERRVEARHLRQFRQQAAQRLDRRHVVRLMQRRQRDQFGECRQRRIGDARGRRELRSPMDHAMPGAEPFLRARGNRRAGRSSAAARRRGWPAPRHRPNRPALLWHRRPRGGSCPGRCRRPGPSDPEPDRPRRSREVANLTLEEPALRTRKRWVMSPRWSIGSAAIIGPARLTQPGQARRRRPVTTRVAVCAQRAPASAPHGSDIT